MFAKTSLTKPLLVLILVTVLIVTTAVAFIAIGSEYRTHKFFLSLIALLFAESMVFGYPIYLSATSDITNSPRLALGIGMYVAFLIYGAGTVALALLAMTPIEFAWLGLLHVIMFGSMVIFLLVWKITSSELSAVSKSEAESRRFIYDCRRRIVSLSELPSLPDDVRTALRKLRGVAQFAVTESKPTSAAIELKLFQLLGQLEENLGTAPHVDNSTDSIGYNEETLRLIALLTHSFNERGIIIR